METSNHLIHKPIPQLIRQLSIPVGIGMLFNTMFNIVDNYFAGWISTNALAALSISFPIFFFVIAVGGGVSNGVNALISTSLGAEKQQQAAYTATQAVPFYLMLSVLLTGLYFLFRESVFRYLGADDRLLRDALLYMDVIYACSVFFFVTFLCNAILSAQGDTRSFRNFLVSGFFLNLILDPLFVKGFLFIPPMGLQGIGIATVLVEACGSIYLTYRVFKSGILNEAKWPWLIPEKKELIKIASQGIPASMNLITISIGVFVITYFIAKFGEEVLAAYGVALRIEQIFLLPILGLNAATLTLVAQNHGAGKIDRLKETVNKSILYGSVISILGSAFIYISSSRAVSLFTKDPKVVREGAVYLKIAAFIFLAYVILFIASAALQGIKKPGLTLWIGLYRQLVAPFLIFFVAVEIYNMGVNAVWWGIFWVTWSAALLTWFLLYYLIRKLPSSERLA